MKEESTLYSEIIERLENVRKKENRLAFFYGMLTTFFIAVIVVLDAVILERAFSFDVLGRTILFIVSTLCVAGSFVWFAGRPLLKLIGILQSDNNSLLASKVGNFFPHIRDRLLDALEMYERREHLQNYYSVQLIDASFDDLYQQIQPLDFSKVVSNEHVRKMQRFVTLAGGLFLLVFVLSPAGFLDSLYRIARFNTSYAAPLPIQFIIEPGNVEAVRGDNVPISIRTSGKPIQSLSLLTRQEGRLEFDAQSLSRNNEGMFQSELTSIKQSTEYYVSAEDISSDKFKITVLDRPLVRSLRIKVAPPAYTRLPSRFLDEGTGDIKSYSGTRIDFEVISSKPLTSAMLVFNDSSRLMMKSSGPASTVGLTLKKNSTYHILLRDENGLTNVDPVEYTIKIVPDEYPTVEILSPGKNLNLTENMKLDLFIRIKDDFGFTKLRLGYRLAQSRYEQPHEDFSFLDITFIAQHQNSADVRYSWDLTNLHLVPEDVVVYYVEVFDNDNINGPKSGRSETFLLRLPSLEEVFSDVAESHDQSLETMQQVRKETEQLKKDVEEMQREMKKNNNKMDWQQQQKAQQMMERYNSMKQKLEESSRKLDEMMKQMEDNKLLSDKTLEKYMELQKLMEQLQSPELQEALKKLQQSMKQMSPEEMKKAMEQLQFSEEQFRQSLERTIELLKRIHIEQKLDELIKRTEELIKQQEALKEQAAQTNPSDKQKLDELAKQQQDLQQQLESLQKETSDLQKKMEEFAKEMPLDEMKQAQEELDQQQLDQAMEQAAQQMQSGQMSEAQKNQQKSSKGLQKFMQQMQAAQKALQDKQMQQVVNEMKRQLQNVIELSKREEELKDETKGLDPNSQRFRENAQEQMDVMNDLSNVAQSLSDLAKKTFAIGPELGKEIGNAMKQMEQAMKNMEGRNPGGTSQQQQQAMTSLNRAVMMMQSMLNGMMQGGQGGMGMAGLMSRLNQMMGQQSGINAGTQQAMGQGQGLTSEQQAEYQRLGAQQGAVQKSLEQLANEAKNSGEFSKLLGDLDKIADEMKEVQTDLEQGNVNPETIQKQERILSRLLDSQRSMRERDYEKRRRAEAGKEYQKLSPTELDLSTQEGKSRLRQELLKVLEGKYSKDYEELIRKYFEQLEKVEDSTRREESKQ
jgi:hypothetical protein